MALTLAAIKRAKPGMHSDGGGLYLRVKPTGAKSWVQRLTVNGKRTAAGLGTYPDVTLARARDLAATNRVMVSMGRDPIEEKRRGPVPTFAESARAAHEHWLPTWGNKKHSDDWIRSLEAYAFPSIGRLPVDRIERGDVLRCLEPLWRDGKWDRADRVRSRIKRVLGRELGYGRIEVNPAGEAIDQVLPRCPKVKQRHFRALAYPDVPAALETVDGSRASLAVRSCLRFLILTAVRSGEARGATWGEIDREAREWRIPGERMKAGIEHRVPLSDAALAVLDRVEPLREQGDLVFPSPSKVGRPLSDMTLTKLLRGQRARGEHTVHGFRSAFRDWAAERTNAAHAVMELCLAHQVGSDVERAYARSDLLERRRHLMSQWADYATATAPAKVVNLRG